MKKIIIISLLLNIVFISCSRGPNKKIIDITTNSLKTTINDKGAFVNFIDIKNEIENKVNAMKLYKNEIRKYPHPRSIESIKHTAGKWGTVSGFIAAEAFQLIRKFEK